MTSKSTVVCQSNMLMPLMDLIRALKAQLAPFYRQYRVDSHKAQLLALRCVLNYSVCRAHAIKF